MPNKLENIVTAELSLVPKGAVKKRFFLRKEDAEVEEIIKAILEKELDLEAIDKLSISDKAKAAIKGAAKLLNAYKDDLTPDVIDVLMECAGVERKKKEKDEDKKKKKPEYGYAYPVKKDGTLDLEVIPEEMRPMVEVLWKEAQENKKRADEAVKKAQEIEDKAKQAEFIAKAEKEMGFLPIVPSKLGPILKSIAENLPDIYPEIEGLLKQVSKISEQSKLFKAVGSDARDVSAWNAIEAKAQEIIAKENITKEQAIAKVLRQNPELYEVYRRELM